MESQNRSDRVEVLLGILHGILVHAAKRPHSADLVRQCKRFAEKERLDDEQEMLYAI